jgi:hypothetical protein
MKNYLSKIPGKILTQADYAVSILKRATHLRRDNRQGLTVRPEPVEGWAVKPFMVRQAHHERLNLKLSRVKLKAKKG